MDGGRYASGGTPKYILFRSKDGVIINAEQVEVGLRCTIFGTWVLEKELHAILSD